MNAGGRSGARIPVNQRGAARLHAVQALYQMEVGGAGVCAVVDEYENHRIGRELDGNLYGKADAAWFRAVVTGVVERQRALDPLIGAALVDGWPLSRLDATLRAILRAGAFELAHRPDVPVAVIVKEYAEIGRAFFDDGQPKLIHAVLDTIARRVRAAGGQLSHGAS